MDILAALLLFFAMDAVGDDWRDRFNSTSIVYRFFDWLRHKAGWDWLWVWYAGTKEGPLKRFLRIPYDAWHSFKHIRNASLAYVCYDINGWYGVITVVLVAALWFPLVYHGLEKKQPFKVV